ncbi:MAG: hypothetical protein LBP35_02915 [Candidatus Ancillula trichonymphae]|nr:hypothetical protein [Candidatus Ancillula trichonymphae]
MKRHHSRVVYSLVIPTISVLVAYSTVDKYNFKISRAICAIICSHSHLQRCDISAERQ